MYKNIISYFDEANQQLIVVAALAFEKERQAIEDFERVKAVRECGGALRLHLVDDDGDDIEVIYVSLGVIEELLGQQVTLEALQYIASRQAKGEMVTLLDYDERNNEGV